MMYNPPDSNSQIEQIKRQITRLQKTVEDTRKRKEQLVQELTTITKAVFELTIQEDKDAQNFYKCENSLYSEEKITLPKLQNEVTQRYQERQQAKRDKNIAKQRDDNAQETAQNADRNVENAEKTRNQCQEELNKAINKPYSITKIGELSPEEIYVKQCHEKLAQAQKEVDKMLQKQKDAYDKKFNTGFELGKAEQKLSMAESSYESARTQVDNCNDRIKNLQNNVNTAKNRLQETRSKLAEKKARSVVLNGSEIPIAISLASEAETTSTIYKPQLEARLRELMAAQSRQPRMMY